MSRAHPTQRVLAAVLAVLGPVVVLAGALQVLWSYTDAEDRQAMENAGRIVNARVLQDSAPRAMERALRQQEPQVLLVGPSYANTDVNPALLADRLGLPRDDVLMLSVPNSVGAHWYAMLKHRVFANGHRPRLVVVISGLQSMLLTTPLTEASYLNLAVHLDEPDPVIDAKVRASSQLVLGRLREKRGKLRDAFFRVVRDVPPSLLFRSPHDPTVSMRPQEVRGALDRVFDDAHVDMSLHGSSTVVIDAAREERHYDLSLLAAPQDSFIPDITSLARDHHAHVVWVRPPMSPDIPEELDDVVLPGTQEATVDLVRQLGGSYLDMRSLPMSTDMFKNVDHMNAEGSRRFTEALARALQRLDVLVDAPETALPPPRAVVTVEDQPGGVPPAAQAVLGEGSWVGPGATLRVHLPDGWKAERGPLAVGLLTEQVEETGGPRLQVAEQEVRLEPRAGGWRAQDVRRRPEGPFELTLSVPPGGPWVRVAALSLGEGPARVVVVGDEGALDGVAAPLFGVFRYEDGVMIDETVLPAYAGPPPPVPHADRPVEAGQDRIGFYDTHRWDFLSDERLMGQTHFGSRCSPLRVTEDGVELPLANVPCVEVKRKGEGRSCHTPEGIYFTTVDGSDPRTNGRTYRLTLDAGRRCDGAVWLYPKDAFTVTWPKDRLSVFRRGADRLTLGARYLQKRKTHIEVVLRVNGEPRLREQINGLDFQSGALSFPIVPPVPKDADVTLEIRNLDHTFYLFEEATLREGGARSR